VSFVFKGNDAIDDDENDPIIGIKHIKTGGLRPHIDLTRPIVKRRKKRAKKVASEGKKVVFF
jgi:hypothetical protein